MKKNILLCALFCCFLHFSYSQAGKLDSSFGNNGVVLANFGASFIYPFSAKKVLLNPQGGIYIISQTYIAKRLPNGLTDSAYGQNGVSATSKISRNDAAVQSDGKIVEVGVANGNFGIVRYNIDGSLDSTFGDNGSLTDFKYNSVATTVALQKDGKIVAAGYTVRDEGKYGDGFFLAIARYNKDGSIDSSFGVDGKGQVSAGPAKSIAIQNDGKIVIISAVSFFASSNAAITRLNTNGSLDTTFAGSGMVEWQQGDFDGNSVLAIQINGKIVVASGSHWNGSNYDNALASYNTNGSVDSTFSEDGLQVNNFHIASLAIENDGKIVVAGDSSLARYNADGTPDNSFSNDGVQENSFAIASIAFQSDGKIVTAGSGFGRYNAVGSVDNTFNKDGNLPVPDKGNTAFTKIKAQIDGKIVVIGSTWNGSSFENILARYNTNGSLDSTFSEDGIKVNPFPGTSLAVCNNGKIVVTGDSLLARYNTDGSLDSSFSEDGIQHNDFAIQAAASQSDGKIVVVGSAFAKDDSGVDYPGFAVARYNTAGNLDNSFSGDGKLTKLFYNEVDEYFTLNSSAYLVGIQTDGKIVVAGSVSGNQASFYVQGGEIVRYNTDGNLDSTFGGRIGTPVSLALGSNGNIVVQIVNLADQNSDVNEASIISLGPNNFSVRLPYLSFQNPLVAVQSDGKILIKGNYLVRLNADGTSDTKFGQPTTEGSVSDIAFNNNKLYTAGAGSDLGNVGVIARYLLDSRSTPPTASFTTPANNATYLAPAAHIKLSAAASDADGTISKVEFYNGTALLDLVTAAPYDYVWKNVQLGNYTLTAKAYDNSGLSTTSDAVHISVVPNKPPTVNIIAPLDNEHYAAPAYIHLEAAASDTDGRITRVEFYNGSTLIRTEYKYPYTYVWRDVPAGTYSITAVATDNWGAQTTSVPVTVRVKTPGAIVSSRPSSEKDKAALNDALILQLTPNPAANIVTIFTSGLQQNKPATLSIISVSGIVLKTIHINGSAQTVPLDISSLISGVYAIKMISGDKVRYKQFVKL